MATDKHRHSGTGHTPPGGHIQQHIQFLQLQIWPTGTAKFNSKLWANVLLQVEETELRKCRHYSERKLCFRNSNKLSLINVYIIMSFIITIIHSITYC